MFQLPEEGIRGPPTSPVIVLPTLVSPVTCPVIVPLPTVHVMLESDEPKVPTRIFGATDEPINNCPSVVIARLGITFPEKSTLSDHTIEFPLASFAKPGIIYPMKLPYK